MEEKMENTLSVSLMVAFLLIGAVGGYVITPEKVVTEQVEVEVPVEVPVDNIVEVEVADASEYLVKAESDFMEYVDDEELFDCGKYEYDLDEISVSRVYDDWTLEFDEEDYTVNFEVKLRYDEDDERSCKETYNVEAYYEEGEDVKITV